MRRYTGLALGFVMAGALVTAATVPATHTAAVGRADTILNSPGQPSPWRVTAVLNSPGQPSPWRVATILNSPGQPSPWRVAAVL